MDYNEYLRQKNKKIKNKHNNKMNKMLQKNQRITKKKGSCIFFEKVFHSLKFFFF